MKLLLLYIKIVNTNGLSKNFSIDATVMHGCSSCLHISFDSSRADFSEEPAFSWMTKLTEEVKMAIQQAKILFCNGYAFDELLPDLIVSALDYAIGAGTTVFFDPGPRGRTLAHGTPDEQKALELFLKQSDVLLLTSDEVHMQHCFITLWYLPYL